MARCGVIVGKPGYVNLVLTEREAKALWSAASTLLEHRDETEAHFERQPESGQNRAAAFRAYDTLGRGWVQAQRAREE
jgi:hypothetical protein